MTWQITITDRFGTRVEEYPTKEMADRAFRVLSDYSGTTVTPPVKKEG